MPDFFFLLKKVFELEKQKSYSNQSVTGGFEKFTNFASAELAKIKVPSDSINLIIETLDNYHHFSVSERKYVINQMLAWLDNDPEDDYSNLDKIKGKLQEVNHSNHPHELIEQEKGLFADIKTIRGIGEKNSRIYNKLGVNKVYDLLRYYPRRYQDYSKLIPINQIKYGDEISIIGKIIQTPLLRKSKNKNLKIIESAVSDGSGIIRLTWFNNPYIIKQLQQGMTIVVSGKVDIYLGRFVINHPEWELIDSNQLSTNRIVPVYPLSAGITQRQVRTAIDSCLRVWRNRVKEFFNNEIISNEKLCTINHSLSQIHFPESEHDLKSAQDRLAFEEIFFLQLGVFVQKKDWSHTTAKRFVVDDLILNDSINKLPYELTQAQLKAIDEMIHDLKSGRPMNRLLQGDVGSGKTVVARFAAEIITRNSSQVAIMAPTAILAEQHYRTFNNMLVEKYILEKNEIALLLGSTPEKERKNVLERLSSGFIKIIIGTHALIEDPVNFHDLQLAIIDEQHRFGVSQRAMLRKKGESPHLLVMTATPIPRSLAMTIYGDLDVSTIDEMPVGRKPVQTNVISPNNREVAYGMVLEQLSKGFQAFIIYPLIESEDDENLLAVMNEYDRLSKNIFPNFSLGFIHGKLKPAEKDSIMHDFRDKKFEILISTTVVEVGVDIPNATIVIIEGANRFGLAQLHQIRGRVGRSDYESFCVLIPESENGFENERLLAMTKTNDGFLLADYDLKQRGPGEFLGTRQSGFLRMRFANVTDIGLIEKCRKHALKIFQNDPNLTKPENQLLKNELTYYWPDINLIQ